MAEIKMGEVDEMHSKDEGVIANGDLVDNDVDMEDSEDGVKKLPLPEEKMDVDSETENIEEAKENNEFNELDTKTDSVDTDELKEQSDDTRENSCESQEPSSKDIDNNDENLSENEKEGNSIDQDDEAAESGDEKEENSIDQDEEAAESGDEKEVNSVEQDEEAAESGDEKEENSIEQDEEAAESGDEKEHSIEQDDEAAESGNEEVDETLLNESGNEEDNEDEIEGVEKDDEEKDNEEKDSEKNEENDDEEKDEDDDDELEEGEVRVNPTMDGEIHEIDDNDDSNSLPSKSTADETIELNDSAGEDDGDIMIVESTDAPKENGRKKTDIIDLATPEKKPPTPEVITPRRSTRNLNKSKSYAFDEKETPPLSPQSTEESDIEEVQLEDPLAVSDAITIEKIPKKPSTIVVKDTKKLVEIASKSNPPGKKEPTLVIIDTNSILSGRGPIPVNNKTSTISTSNYSNVLPMALPAQGMYPPNMRATITPIPNNSLSNKPTTPISPAIQTPLLPTLTDDMFVVEAPSFIVPYVYEKPPVKDFKGFVSEYKKQVEEILKKEEEEDIKSGKASKSTESAESEVKQESAKKRKKNPDDDDDYKVEEDKDVDSEEEVKIVKTDASKTPTYFDSPLGKFFMDIGFNMVQEFVQSDLLKQQKRKRDREGGANKETEKTIHSLIKSLEYSKENNQAFKMTLKKCEFCNFKTESALAMSYHLETPHMKNFVYRCNFCSYEVRSPHDILFHMEAEHTVRGHLERAPAFHQCSNCPFEDNQKGKLSRHLVACAKKFKPERNLEPPMDWEPPAKIPRVPKMRQQGLNATAAAYQAMSKNSQYQFLSKMQIATAQQNLQRGRGRPNMGMPVKQQPVIRPTGMVFKQTVGGGSVLVPTNYQLSGNQVFQVIGGQDLGGRLGNHGQMSYLPNMSASSTIPNQQQQQQSNTANKKPVHQPSISITPLPRASASASNTNNVTAKPGDNNSKNSFVICEICDGYIKDLEQLRNHMQWIHKIKIHPKMIYNRPPLNCQKCQFRFFTDQGLERHLLGSHGLVTSSMQDAANKSKDSGRCPVCGRVYQWKLLNHVARDHNMTLKPAHLSYKCTVCTATFGMYKQFENHVYSAHSVVAKRVMDKKNASPASANKTNDQLKPLKINDEITIIPQPAKTNGNASKEGSSATGSKNSTPSTSKNKDDPPVSETIDLSMGTSRAERLARRKGTSDD